MAKSADPSKKTIVSFGELLWDLMPSGTILGGAPANLAYRINSLGDNGIIVSRLGRDQLGREALEQLKRLGMETRYLQWDDRSPTGIVQVQVDAKGNPDFFIVPEVAYDYLECNESLIELTANSDCLCFGTLIQRAAVSRGAFKKILSAAPDTLRFIDLNLRKDCFSPETIVDSLTEADILKINKQEAQYLASLFRLSIASLPDFAREMINRWQLTHCLITLGEFGALAVSAKREVAYSPGYKVTLKDTCGSGDAFSAGFLYGHLHGQPLDQCLQRGNALGALVATQHGATGTIAPETVEGFLNGRKRIIDPALLI